VSLHFEKVKIFCFYRIITKKCDDVMKEIEDTAEVFMYFCLNLFQKIQLFGLSFISLSNPSFSKLIFTV